MYKHLYNNSNLESLIHLVNNFEASLNQNLASRGSDRSFLFKPSYFFAISKLRPSSTHNSINFNTFPAKLESVRVPLTDIVLKRVINRIVIEMI